jgi:hypothetical protein
VLFGQRQDLIVEPVLDIAQLFDRANFLAKGLDVVEQPPLLGWLHETDLLGFHVAANLAGQLTG